MRTHYQNLKVAENAPREVIKSTYRKLCLKHHPDRNPGNADSQRIMQIINDVYDILSDPVKRRAYDQELALRRAQQSQPQRTASHSAQSGRGASYQAPPQRPRNYASNYGPTPDWRPHYSRPAPRNGFQWFMQETGMTYGMLFIFLCVTAANIYHHVQGGTTLPWGASGERGNLPARTHSAASVTNYVRPTKAPNGQPWPDKSDYIKGYPPSAMTGQSKVELDNPPGHPDLFVKLIYARGNRPRSVRTVFLQGGTSVTLKQISPGLFDIRFQNLDTGAIRKIRPFELKDASASERTEATHRFFRFADPSDGGAESDEIDESGFNL